jgi:NAD(P)H dehydrogenase (quinone)
MQDVNVVVVFYSRTGSTERLALAAAVGAVQGRAFIRLRRLPDAADESTVDTVPGWKENRERMNREYVAPRETDATWADAIIVGMPAGTETLSAECERYFDSLCALRDQGKFEGKVGSSFTQGAETGPLYAAMSRAGVIIVPVTPNPDGLEAARLQGRRVADMARSLRTAREVK